MGIARASAIVAWPNEPGSTDSLDVYYEGNLYGAVNMMRYAERCMCAHGRMAMKYPTVAFGRFPANLFLLVGVWHPREKVVEVSNMNALAAWCGWKLPVSSTALSAGY